MATMTRHVCPRREEQQPRAARELLHTHTHTRKLHKKRTEKQLRGLEVALLNPLGYGLFDDMRPKEKSAEVTVTVTSSEFAKPRV